MPKFGVIFKAKFGYDPLQCVSNMLQSKNLKSHLPNKKDANSIYKSMQNNIKELQFSGTVKVYIHNIITFLFFFFVHTDLKITITSYVNIKASVIKVKNACPK